MLDFSSYFSLIFLGFISGASQVRLGRSILGRHCRKIFIFSLAVIFGFEIILSLLQYKLWLDSPLTRLLLPPYQGIGYFIFFATSRFFLPYLISLAIALLLLFGLPLINKRFSERFFETEEPYLAATAVFLVSHPGWLIYFVILISAYLILHTTYFILWRPSLDSPRSSRRGGEAARLPLYRLWGITALFVILINKYWLIEADWWNLLAV